MAQWTLPVAGGMLVGIAAGLVLILNGRLAGVSGLLATLVGPGRADVGWRAAFLAGLVAGGAALSLAYPTAIPGETPPVATMIVAGVLVGIGASYAGGCTSGHGLLGVGRLAWRSVVATMVFMGTGMLTVTIARHWAGAGL